MYFVNGDLNRPNAFPNVPEGYYVVDASRGYSYCVHTLTTYKSWDNCTVLTNFVGALKSDVCFDNTSQMFDLFLVSPYDNKWHNVQELTSRSLRYSHNIEKMYCAGEFSMSVSNSRQVWEYVVDKVIGSNDNNVCAWLTGSRLLGYNTDKSDYDVDIVIVPTLDQLKLGNAPKERRGVEQYCVEGTDVTVEYVVRDALKQLRMIRQGDVRSNLVGEVVHEHCGNDNVFAVVRHMSFATQYTPERLDALKGFVHNRLKGWDNNFYSVTGLKCLVQAVRYALLISRDFVDHINVPYWDTGTQTVQLQELYTKIRGWNVLWSNGDTITNFDDLEEAASAVKKSIEQVMDQSTPVDKCVTDKELLKHINCLMNQFS